MQASNKSVFKASLPFALAAMLVVAPAAFAKKDLFGSDPAGKPSAPAQEYVPASKESAAAAPEVSPEEAKAISVEKKAPESKEPSYLEKQFTRLKSNLAEAKNDLFGKKDAKDKPAKTVAPAPQEANANSSDSAEVAPAISPTEAAQRAQLVANGQVMNVRKYQDEDKTRYAVKLLEKNGRMKTVTIDANTGELIEEPTQ